MNRNPGLIATPNMTPGDITKAIRTAQLAAKTGKVMTSGTEQEKAAAIEAVAMTAMAMAPGGMYMVAIYSAFKALAAAFPAHGKFPVSSVADQMWQSNYGCFDPSCMTDPPLIGVWKQACSTVELVWNVVRIAKKLDPAPVSIRAEFLVPLDPVDRLTMAWPNEHLISANPNAGIAPETMIQGANQCLLYWLNGYVDGWATRHGCAQYAGSERATVQNTPLLGAPEQGNVIPNDGRDPDVWWGLGPFGLLTDNWSKDCQANCQNLFAACVREVWNYRLEALSKAMPELCGAVMGQIILEEYTSPRADRTFVSADLLRNTYNAALRGTSFTTDDEGWSTGTKVTVGVITLGALGGLGYWLRKTKKWPFTKDWMPFKK